MGFQVECEPRKAGAVVGVERRGASNIWAV